MQLQAFVPLLTYPASNSDSIATHAVSYASRLGAKLHAAAINVEIPDVSNALSRLLLDTPELIKRAEAESRQRGEKLLSAVQERATAAGVEAVTFAFAAPIPALGEAAATRARYFDVSLVGWESGNPMSRLTAEAVVFGSGRPTVLMPEQIEAIAFDHVAIGWDGSRVASRAVADAGPLIERAARVAVITVLDEKPLKERDAAERLAQGLHERGLNAEVVPVFAEDCPIAETLQRSALEKNCQLLVMGGYGHSRIRDFVLGGATEGILTDLKMPVLLSH